MKNKNLAFAKNMIISTAAMVAGAAGASEIADDFTDNGKIVGAVSTISQYIAGWAVFLPLQAYDNRDVYRTPDGKFDKKQFAIDNTKFGVSFLALDALYVLTRPFVQDYLMKKGVDAGTASILTDCAYIPGYAVAAFVLGKATGVIRPSKKSLEDNL
jgi:hypothetical protein